MRATAAPEEGNKVRLPVEIDEAEMDEALDDVLQRLAREVRVPGFRPGQGATQGPRVPDGRRRRPARRGDPRGTPGVLLAGRRRDGVDPIDQPDIDITGGEESGPVSFEAVVQVRPVVAIPGYAGLVVPCRPWRWARRR